MVSSTAILTQVSIERVFIGCRRAKRNQCQVNSIVFLVPFAMKSSYWFTSFAAIVGSGQHNKVAENFGHVMGSFGRANHAGAVVVSARNTAGNVATTVDDPQLHCESTGENTITLCSEDRNGVIINDVNVVDELDAVKLRAEGNAAFILAAIEAIALLAQNISDIPVVELQNDIDTVTQQAAANDLALTAALERIATLEQNLSTALNVIANIDDACLDAGRRRLQANPCVVAPPTSTPTASPPPIDAAIVAAASVGGIFLLAALAALIHRRSQKPHVTGPMAIAGDYDERLFDSKQDSTRSSKPLPPPTHPPPSESGKRPPTPPPRRRRRRKERNEQTSSTSWIRNLYGRSSEAFHQIFLRSSAHDAQRLEETEEKSQESKDTTLPVFAQRPSGQSSDEDDDDYGKETIF